MRRSETALLARGVDAGTASRLVGDGWTVSRLKQLGKQALTDLGIAPEVVGTLLAGGRPPIPFETITRVLFGNRFQCCVCREPRKPIILHHIEPWAETRDHSASNLAVLCLDHHEQAHSTSSLARNLDQATLKAFKLQWEAECAKLDAQSVLSASRLDFDAWLYFNHVRLFELVGELKVPIRSAKGYDRALADGLINSDGTLRQRPSSLSYMYDDVGGMILYAYVRDVWQNALRRLTVINLSDLLDRGIAHSLIAPGDFVFVQGAHTFQHLTRVRRGRGEVMKGTRKVNGVEITYTFDRWEATSCSAWATWLTGRQSVGSLIQVRSIERGGDGLVISGTVLAISNGHSRLKTREYSPRFGRFVIYPDDDDDDDDSFDEWNNPLAEDDWSKLQSGDPEQHAD